VIRPLVDLMLFANGMMEILVGPLLQLSPLSRPVEQHLVLCRHEVCNWGATVM
jgi:hypothetical protein